MAGAAPPPTFPSPSRPPHRRRWRIPASALLLLVPFLYLVPFFAWPLSRTLEAAWGHEEVWEWLRGPYIEERLGTAFRQAVLSVALALGAAVLVALLHHARRVRGERLHLALHAFPFVLPVFVVVFGLQAVLGPQGWTDRLWHEAPLLAGGPLWAVAIANAYYNYGFAARLLHTALERRPRHLEAAARTLGASGPAAFLRVSLPLLWPSVLAVALLVFLFSFASFGVVRLLGNGEISTLETLLYSNRFDRPRAAALGLLQLAINLTLLSAYMLLRRREARIPRVGEAERPAAGPFLTGLAWALAALGLLPVVSVLVGGFQVAGEWSLEPWRSLVHDSHPLHPWGLDLLIVMRRSLAYAGAAAGLSLLLTLSLGYGARRLGGPWRRAAEVLAALPLGTSSILIGFGYLLAFGAGDFLDLRGTRTVVVLAHTLVAFPFTARAVLPALDSHDTRLDEAASLLGAPPRSVLRRIHWPLLRPTFVVALGFAVALSLGDYGSSLLLMRTETRGLGVWIDAIQEPFDPFPRAQAMALAGLLGALAAAAYLAVERFGGSGRLPDAGVER